MGFKSELLDAIGHECVLMEKTRVPDGEGGWVTAWKEGARFTNYQHLDSTTEALIAEQQGVTSLYELLVRKDFPIEYNDAFKDLKTDKTYRVATDPEDDVSPNISPLDLKRFRAERWTLPT